MTNLNFDIFGSDHGLGRTLEGLTRKVDDLQDELNKLDRTTADPVIRIDKEPFERGIREIRAELARLEDARIKITASADQARREIKQVQATLARLRDAKLEIQLDTAAAREELNNLQQDLRELEAKDASVEVDADITAAKARIKELKADLSRLTGERLNIDANTAGARTALSALKTQLASLKDQHLAVDADTAAATAKLAALEAEVAVLSRDVHINVDVDAGGAVAELALVRRNLNDTNRDGQSLFRTFAEGFRGVQSLSHGFTTFSAAISTTFGLVGKGALQAITGIQGMASAFGSGGTGLAGAASAAGAALSGMVSVFAGMTIIGSVAGLIGVAVAGLAQLGGAAVALVSGLAPLVALLTTLPGLIAPVGVAVGALVIAFGDAGLKKEVENLQKSFEPLVTSIRDQLRPALTNLLQSVEGLAPIFQRVAPIITSAISDVANRFAAMFRESSFQADLQTILTQAAGHIQTFGQIGQTALRGVIDMMIAVAPATSSLVTLISDLTTRWANFMAEARRTGELNTFVQQGVDVLRQLFDVATNVAGAFKDLWDSAQRTGAFQAVLGAINTGITQFRDYVSQAGGSWDQLMTKVGEVTPQIIGLIGTIGDAFVQIGANVNLGPAIDGISAAIQGLIPLFQQTGQAVSDAIGTLGPIIGDVAQKFAPSLAESVRTATDAAGLFITAMGQLSLPLLQVVQDIAAVVVGIASLITSIPGLTTLVQLFFEAWLFAKVVTGLAGMVTSIQAAATALGLMKTAAAEAAVAETAAGTAATGLLGPLGLLAVASLAAFSPEGQKLILGWKDSLDQLLGVTRDANGVVTGFGASTEEMAASAKDSTFDISNLGGAVADVKAKVANDITAKFKADTGNILEGIDTAKGAVDGFPETHNTNLLADPSDVLSKADQAKGAVQGITTPGPPPITLLADPSDVLSKADQAKGAVQGITTPGPPPITLLADPSDVLSKADQAKGAVQGITTPGPPPVTLLADPSDVLSKADQAKGAVQGITTPGPPPVTLLADPSDVLSKADTAKGAVQGITTPGPPPITLLADPSDVLSKADTAKGAVNAIPQAHNTNLLADPSDVLGKTQSGTAAINAVPPDHNTNLLADPSDVLSKSASANQTIDGIRPDHNTDINARDNASGVIQGIISLLGQIKTSITTTVTTVYHSVFGAEGMILPEIAPMASGGSLHNRTLRPNMSSSSARIVHPNTWRVIGDRMSGDEAFIPIERSARSVALLGQTANRMGFALMPMAQGGRVVPEDYRQTNTTVAQLYPGYAAARDKGFTGTASQFYGANTAAAHAYARNQLLSSQMGTFTVTAMGRGGMVPEDYGQTNTTVAQLYPEYAHARDRGFTGTASEFYGNRTAAAHDYARGVLASQRETYNRRRHGRDEWAWEWLRRHRGGGRTRPPLDERVSGVLSSATRPVGFGGGTASITSASHRTSRLATYGALAPQPVPGGGGVGGVGGPQPVHINIATGNPSLDQALLEILRRAIRVQGGNVQLVMGS